MNFGETIKKLRRQKDMTQEQLAEYLNISTQAVSKWETNLSLPDISLLPMLANIFDTSADVLLGIDITAKDKRIQEILDHAMQYDSKGYKEKSAEILRAGLKEYPNSFRIMALLIHSVWSFSNYSENNYETPEARENERAELRKEVIYLGEKILAECNDTEHRETAIQLLCYTYPTIGEAEKAEKLALTLSGLNPSDLLVNIYSGEKRFKYKQDCIQNFLTNLLLHMDTNNGTLDDGSRPYTPEECIIIAKKEIAIIEIIFEDGNYGYYQQWIAWRYKDIANSYAQIGDYENALKYLQSGADAAIKSDLEFNPEKEYTALLFKGKKVGKVYHNVTGNDSMEQLDLMKYKVFDPIRDNPEFIAIEEKLKQYAKKRE